MRIFLSLLLLVVVSFSAFCAHLVGGEITYTCTGNNNYLITLRIYRDCNSGGAPFDPNAAITIYDAAGNIVQNLSVPMGPVIPIPPVVNNPCLQVPPNVCTEYTEYLATVNLPPLAGGYTITHQRCCRNNTINNIPNPDTWGNTFTTSIPSMDNSCNSSPAFTNLPPIVLCNLDTLHFDFSAPDPDADSVYYALCSPVHGGGQNTGTSGTFTSPAPNPAAPPPYSTLPFLPSYSATNPIPGNPGFSINPTTGMLIGRPTQLGQYVFAVCVYSYNAQGQLLNVISRDYQFNVVNCVANTVANMVDQDPTAVCTGLTVQFQELCQITSFYLWDFGVAGTSNDTSTLANPVFTFPDSGLYAVTLIANPGWGCSDTVVKYFRVYNPFNASLQVLGDVCFDTQNFTFQAAGSFSPNAQFTWEFSGASTTMASGQVVTGVQFLTPGSHYVQLTIEDNGCLLTLGDSVEVFRRPVLLDQLPQISGCSPLYIQFRDSSRADSPGYHFWDFGDGTTSTLSNPSHTYQNPGTYSVTHSFYTTTGCRDSLTNVIVQGITAFPKPQAAATITPAEPDPYYPIIEVTHLPALNQAGWYTRMGDGTTISNQPYFQHLYRDTGYYLVEHVVQNGSGCTDTLKKWIWVKSVVHLFVPNAFSPNGDGINDALTLGLLGMDDFTFTIYNRWGERVFETSLPNDSWNGKFLNTGGEVQQGVYTYRLVGRDASNEFHEKVGYITLFR